MNSEWPVKVFLKVVVHEGSMIVKLQTFSQSALALILTFLKLKMTEKTTV